MIKGQSRFIFAYRKPLVVAAFIPEYLTNRTCRSFAKFEVCKAHSDEHLQIQLPSNGREYVIDEESAKLSVAIAERTRCTFLLFQSCHDEDMEKLLSVRPFVEEMLQNASVVALTPWCKKLLLNFAMSPATATTLLANRSDMLGWKKLPEAFPFVHTLEFAQGRRVNFGFDINRAITKKLPPVQFLNRLNKILSFPMGIFWSERNGMTVDYGIVGYMLRLVGGSENLASFEVLALKEFYPLQGGNKSHIHLVRLPQPKRELGKLTVSFAMSWAPDERNQIVETIVAFFEEVGIKIRTVSTRKTKRVPSCVW